MKSGSLIAGSVLASALALSAATATPADAQVSRKDLVAQSSVIFVGTVTEVGGSALMQMPPAPDTVVARVERVIDKPAAVALAPGDLVTIRTKDPTSLQAGARVTFYTNGRVFAENLGVEEVGHEVGAAADGGEAPGAVALAAGASAEEREVEQMRAELGAEQLRERLMAADVVVVGRVVEVREPTVAALAPEARPISEHVADWRDAVIRVESGIKGASAGDEIVVRFPASLDVAWFDYPKLTVGETGTFILQRDTISGTPTARLAGATVDAYTVPQPGDVLPADEAERIRGLLEPR